MVPVVALPGWILLSNAISVEKRFEPNGVIHIVSPKIITKRVWKELGPKELFLLHGLEQKQAQVEFERLTLEELIGRHPDYREFKIQFLSAISNKVKTEYDRQLSSIFEEISPKIIADLTEPNKELTVADIIKIVTKELLASKEKDKHGIKIEILPGNIEFLVSKKLGDNVTIEGGKVNIWKDGGKALGAALLIRECLLNRKPSECISNILSKMKDAFDKSPLEARADDELDILMDEELPEP